MVDPLLAIFGTSSREVFARGELFVQHGPLERLPAFMWQGPMASVDALCRDYTGSVEVAQGSSRSGLQFGVNGAHPAALLQVGLTVFFQDLRRLLGGSTEWLRSLEASLGLPECASFVAFANAPGSGLALHHDRHDQLFFQIRGRKRFRYAPNRYLSSPDLQFSPANAAMPDFGVRYRRGFPLSCDEVLEQPFTSLELEPGSAFFMPAGTWHTTAEQAEQSLSLVVAVRAPSQLDLLLGLLRSYAGQAPEWRERPYGAWSGDERERQQAQARWPTLLADLGRRLSALSADAACAAWSLDNFVHGNQAAYPEHARFERFIRLPNSSLELGDTSASGKLSCTILSGPNHRPQTRTVLGIEPEARPVLEWVATRRAVFSSDSLCAAFPDFAREELLELLLWLGRAGFIRPVPGPEWEE